jgi:hypothetical protein
MEELTDRKRKSNKIKLNNIFADHALETEAAGRHPMQLCGNMVFFLTV